MQNSLGTFFTVTSFGESHGYGTGVVVDGCPAGLPLRADDIQRELERRYPPGPGTTPRREPDRVEILSGTLADHTTGAPICLMVRNKDFDDSAYEELRHRPRPGHADYTASVRYGGFNDWRGGGRFSGRITAGFVMAGAVAKRLLGRLGVEVFAHTVAIGSIKAAPLDHAVVRERAIADPLYCADHEASRRMAALITETQRAGDSLGGVIEGIALNVPAGLGEPVFATLDGELARALFAIPAVKGVEFGAGFAAAAMKGSENNDPFTIKDGKVTTVTNNAGGILGGISSGMPIVVRVAVKPVPSIAREQMTVDMREMKPATLKVTGRHDACIVPRAVPAVEAMMAIVLCDFALGAGLIPRVLR
ncbi:MAG: chorismate synthase [Dehalococcoidales bacterium]|nr:chorismate synthase [Dehalococcoidales bacterium]